MISLTPLSLQEKIQGVVFSVVIAVIASLCLRYGWAAHDLDTRLSTSKSSVEGRITRLGPEDSRHFTVEIAYDYTIAQRQYHGAETVSYRQTQGLVAGTPVTVLYLQENLGTSTLKGFRAEQTMEFVSVIGWLTAAVSGLLLILSIIAPRK